MTEKNVILDISTQRRAELEVLFQDEVQLDINVPLFYIKSGEEDIKQYVERTEKPALDSYVEEKKRALEQVVRDGVEAIGEVQKEAEAGVQAYVDGTVKQEITSYSETTVKPELQSFADGLENAFDTNAAEKTAAVNILAEQAEASAQAAASSLSAVQTAATASAESATAASSAADMAEAWAVGSIEERPEGSAKYWAEKINPDSLADVDLSNLSSAGNAKLPLPWSCFKARSMLADGSIAKDQVRTFTLDYLTNNRLYEVIGSVFFTSNGVVTIRCGSNPTIVSAMASDPVAGSFVVSDSSRGAGTFTALVKNKTIRFSNTGSVTATGVYINVFAFREVGD